MPPEIVSAIIGASVVAIGAMGATVVLLPPFLKKQSELYQKKQETQIATEQKKSEDALEDARQERLAAAEQRQQFGRLIDSLINERTANTEQSQVMVRALTGSVTILDGMAKELRANTVVSTQGAREIGDLTERFDTLLDKGSKPLQELSGRVDELAKGITNVATAQSTIMANQQETTDKVNYIHAKIAEIVSLKSTLDIMLKVAEAKLEDVRKVTGDNPAVNLVITPST